MKIAVVTDSTACLPAQVQESYDRLYVVPLGVTIEGNTFTEDADFDESRVSQAQERGQKVATSRPSPQLFREVYDKACADGAQAIVSIHAARTLSSTIDSAQSAATSLFADLGGEGSPNVTVVDSQSIGMGLGFGVLAALAASNVADAIEHAKSVSTATHTTIYVDTLRYLHAGGRIGRASALLGSALSIKPLLSIAEGVIVPVDRARSSTKALERLMARTAEHVERHRDARSDNVDREGTESKNTALQRAARSQTETSGGEPAPETSSVGAVPHQNRMIIAIHASWPSHDAEKVFERCLDIDGVDIRNVWRVPLGGSVAAHIGAGAIATVVGMAPTDITG